MISTVWPQLLAMWNKANHRIDDDDSPAPIIPPGVITEILTWLPIENLIQLQLVCKDWQSMINDPSYFKQLHMNRSKVIHHWKNIEGPPAEQNREAEQINPGQVRDSVTYEHGCDGLVLLKKTTDRSLCLWNPATRRVLVLPGTTHDKGTLGFALSFIPATESYQIVSFYKSSGGEFGCEVLTPGQSNNVWRRLNNFPEITNKTRETASVVLSGGAVHCVLVGEETNTVIVSLELGTGDFTVVNQFPKLVGRWLDWDGKLAIANVVGQTLEVTELEDYKKRKWCEDKKIIHLPFLEGGNANVKLFPLFACLGDIWFWWKGGKVFTYSTSTGKCTDKTDSQNLYLKTNLYLYKPSLISFQGMVPDTKLEYLRANLRFS